MARSVGSVRDFVLGAVADGGKAGNIISGAFTGISTVAKMMGAPEWIKQFSYGEIILAGAVFWLGFAYVVRRIKYREIEERYEPKLSVAFSTLDDGCYFLNDLQIGNEPIQSMAVRVVVTSACGRAVEKCGAYLKRVTKKHALTGTFVPTKFVQPLRLFWFRQGDGDITVPVGVPQYIQLLSVSEREIEIVTGNQKPLNLVGMFEDHTTYRFTVAVRGEGITQEIDVDIDWAGKWRDVKPRQVEKV